MNAYINPFSGVRNNAIFKSEHPDWGTGRRQDYVAKAPCRYLEIAVRLVGGE